MSIVAKVTYTDETNRTFSEFDLLPFYAKLATPAGRDTSQV